MKTSIIFLGLVALSFTTTKAANQFKSLDLDQQELATLTLENTRQENRLVLVNQEPSKNNTNSINADAVIFYPTSVIKETYVKTIEDVIAENKLITECKEEIFQPFSLEKTTGDCIAEDNLIIESTISNEFFPLDFEKINHSVKNLRVYNSAINLDLKL